MIKKITRVVLIIMMLLGLIAISAYAQEENRKNQETPIGAEVRSNQEVTSIDRSGDGSVKVGDFFVSSRLVADVQTQTGAEIRVMQLMRNVEANIQGAELILRVAQDCNCPEYDRMNEIINLLDVIAVDLDEFDFSRSSKEISQEFVELRTDATELTTQFRELAREVISSEEDREELRELTREVRDNQREEFKQRVQERVREYQIEQFRELVVKLDIQADELVELVIVEEVSIPQARQRLAQLLRERNQEEREQAVQRVRESQTRENIELKERVRDVEEIVRERIEQRDERLEERLVNRFQRVEQRVSDRASPQLFEQVCQSAGGGRSDRASAALFKQVCSGFGEDDSDKVSEEERDRRLENARNERLNILNNRIERVQNKMQEREEIPQACTREYMPVCAQPSMPECPEGRACPDVMPSLQTFGNECMARVADAEIQYQGECRDEDDENDRAEVSTGGGAGKVSIADITFSSRGGGSGGRIALYTTNEKFIQVEGDSSLVSRAEIFLKIEGIEGELRVSVDEDGFLVAEVENLQSETRAMLGLRGVEGEIPVTIEQKSRGDDRPTESLSLSFGKIKVAYSSQGDSQERCERVEQKNSDGEIEVLSFCWGASVAAAVEAQDYNTVRSNKRRSEMGEDETDEGDFGDGNSSTNIEVEADVRVETR